MKFVRVCFHLFIYIYTIFNIYLLFYFLGLYASTRYALVFMTLQLFFQYLLPTCISLSGQGQDSIGSRLTQFLTSIQTNSKGNISKSFQSMSKLVADMLVPAESDLGRSSASVRVYTPLFRFTALLTKQDAMLGGGDPVTPTHVLRAAIAGLLQTLLLSDLSALVGGFPGKKYRNHCRSASTMDIVCGIHRQYHDHPEYAALDEGPFEKGLQGIREFLATSHNSSNLRSLLEHLNIQDIENAFHPRASTSSGHSTRTLSQLEWTDIHVCVCSFSWRMKAEHGYESGIPVMGVALRSFLLRDRCIPVDLIAYHTTPRRWVFSTRQDHTWNEEIPIIVCPLCIVPGTRPSAVDGDDIRTSVGISKTVKRALACFKGRENGPTCVAGDVKSSLVCSLLDEWKSVFECADLKGKGELGQSDVGAVLRACGFAQYQDIPATWVPQMEVVLDIVKELSLKSSTFTFDFLLTMLWHFFIKTGVYNDPEIDVDLHVATCALESLGLGLAASESVFFRTCDDERSYVCVCV
jgi:hypothetical protein